jgi:molecular chaperone IbpA
MDTVAALAPILRSSIGFDNFFRVLDRAVKCRHHVDNPPYNIEKLGDDAYRLTLAVAGWTAAEITITAAPRLLLVAGRKTADSKRYLYRGIPSGSFEHRFDLADDVHVRGAQMTNGLLTVELARVMPEARPPQNIAITASASRGGARSELRLVRPATAGGTEQRVRHEYRTEAPDRPAPAAPFTESE